MVPVKFRETRPFVRDRAEKRLECALILIAALVFILSLILDPLYG